MRRYALMLSTTVLAIGLCPPALADSPDNYLRVVVDELENSEVYIAPDAPNIGASTESELEEYVQDGDDIVLVVLPAEGFADIEDPVTFASQISDELGGDIIVGLSVGDEAYAYSGLLPSGVAADLMHRAETTSMQNISTLQTFASNVRRWKDQHPEQLTTQPDQEVVISDESGNEPILAGVLLLAALVAAGAAFLRKRSKHSVAVKAVTDVYLLEVRPLLDRLMTLRDRLNDPALKYALKACRDDTEAYFERYTSDRKNDAFIFKNNLELMISVMSKYLDVQQNPRYYENPTAELERGKLSAIDFAEFVLQSCREGSAIQLAEYTVNTQILQAQQRSIES